MDIFQIALVSPLLNILIFFYKIFENFGFAIFSLTLLLKIVLFPLTLPSLKTISKQREIAGELAKLKETYGKDKALFAKKQMELYKQHGINPMAGCLPQILQLAFLFALYNVFQTALSFGAKDLSGINERLYLDFLKFPVGIALNTRFFYLDLSKPDPYYILPVIAGLGQYLMSKMMMPKSLTDLEKSVAEKTEAKSDDVMYNMQKQMMYMGPIMTVFFGAKFPSGLVFYWFLQTVFSVIPQWILNRRKQKIS